MKLLTPDICVIGAGSGGLSVAAAAAAFGVQVVLVEKGRMGGDCLNYGCVPSKALIAAASRPRRCALPSSSASPMSSRRSTSRPSCSMCARVIASDRAERFRRALHRAWRHRDQGRGALRRQAHGWWPATPRSGPAASCIATGSSPFVPPIPGLDTVGYLTNETIFDLNRRPGNLIIIGGGPIGVELAQAFRRLGSQVTVIDTGTGACRRTTRNWSAVVRQACAPKASRSARAPRVTRVEQRGKTGVKVFIDGPGGPEEIDGSHILVATGRTANTRGSTCRRPA